MRLDRSRPRPLPAGVVAGQPTLRRQIAAGELRDGDMLPSAREIGAQFGVSMATAAKVATGLQALGLVTARPGAGTVVTAPRPPADRVQGGPIVITLAARGPARAGEDAQVLEAGMAEAPRDVAGQLGLGPMAPVIRRRQATVRDGVTAAVLACGFSARTTLTRWRPGTTSRQLSPTWAAPLRPRPNWRRWHVRVPRSSDPTIRTPGRA